MKRLSALKSVSVTIAALACLLVSSPAGSHSEIELMHVDWPHDGILGMYDKAALQRGFQVYREVCSACHAMHLLSYRNLAMLDYNDAEIKSIAASVTVTDGPNDQGEMFERKGLPSDRFKSPFPNEKASRAANGGAYPKDLSLIVKAREGNEDYVYSLLNGYVKPPEGTTVSNGLYYNAYFAGHQIAMPQPLHDGQVDFGKGVPNSIQDEAKDVVQFLAWASEPHLEERHRLGFEVMIFLGVFAAVMYGAKRRVWKGQH